MKARKFHIIVKTLFAYYKKNRQMQSRTECIRIIQDFYIEIKKNRVKSEMKEMLLCEQDIHFLYKLENPYFLWLVSKLGPWTAYCNC